MNRIISKLIISISLGLILGQLTGYIFPQKKYYRGIEPSNPYRKEISKYEYELEDGDKWENIFSTENHFNKSLSHKIFLFSSCIISLILFVPELKNEKNNDEQIQQG